MHYTNKLGLHEVLAVAIMNKQYSGDGEKRDYSVTELLKPAKQAILMQRHKDEITVDVADQLWAFMGEIAHQILERAVENSDAIKEKYLSENRYKVEYDGLTISGGVDLYDKTTKTITDYKMTSAWTVYFGGRESWEQQLNVYAYILRKHGLEVDHLSIVTLYRDWSKKMINLPKYPKQQSEILTFDVWNDFQVECFLTQKISLLEKYKTLADDDMPECNPKERWGDNGGYWAVQNEKTKKVYKKCDTEQEAIDYLDEKGYKGCEIVQVKAVDRMCQGYCPVKAFCHYGRELPSVEE